MSCLITQSLNFRINDLSHLLEEDSSDRLRKCLLGVFLGEVQLSSWANVMSRKSQKYLNEEHSSENYSLCD